MPAALQEGGTDAELSRKALAYIALLLPNVWLDCVARPLNRILVAQRITTPQMVGAARSVRVVV